MKKVLITGGSGFVGRHLICKLLKQYPEVDIFSLSRSETVIAELLTECPSRRLHIVMADVRDTDAMKYACKGKDTLIHLAAMKRVDLCEDQCLETASINVNGTMNALEAFDGQTFIFMSTDKAVEPVNCYGGTKLVSERLVLERSHHALPGQRFMILRCGNIMGSTGSVMDIWRKQIEEKNEITITNPEMTRFYTSVDDVTRLYSAVLERGENGKIYLTPRGEAKALSDLVRETIAQYGNPQTRTTIVGMRPGERMEEKMCVECEPNVIAGFAEGNGHKESENDRTKMALADKVV